MNQVAREELKYVKEIREVRDIKEVAQMLSSGKWIAIYATANEPFVFSMGRTAEKSPARATNTDKAIKKNTLSIKYTERGRLSNGI